MPKRFTLEQVAKAHHVPYWIMSPEDPKPSWLKRPVWRFRAWRWGREQPRGSQ
jgi:hypothetical protein